MQCGNYVKFDFIAIAAKLAPIYASKRVANGKCMSLLWLTENGARLNKFSAIRSLWTAQQSLRSFPFPWLTYLSVIFKVESKYLSECKAYEFSCLIKRFQKLPESLKFILELAALSALIGLVMSQFGKNYNSIRLDVWARTAAAATDHVSWFLFCFSPIANV